MPVFERFDELLLDAICDRLKPVLYTEGSYIVREGDPIDEMLFIVRGKLTSISTDGGRTGFFNLIYLQAGDFYGEELLPWALESQSSPFHPISTRTISAITEVEASALTAHDLKSLISYHFLHPLPRKQLVQSLRHVQRKTLWLVLSKGMLLFFIKLHDIALSVFKKQTGVFWAIKIVSFLYSFLHKQPWFHY